MISLPCLMMEILCWSKIILNPLSTINGRDTRALSFISLNFYTSLAPSIMFLIFRSQFLFRVKGVVVRLNILYANRVMPSIFTRDPHGGAVYF